MKDSYVTFRKSELITSNNQFLEITISVLSKGCLFRFQASGSSMSPFIKNGDVITLAPPSQKTIHRGTVAAFLSPLAGKLVVHRIVDHKGGKFLLKGDTCRQPDGWVDPLDIIGVVVGVERGDKPVRFGGGQVRGVLACLSKYSVLQFSIGLSYAIYRRLFRGVTHEQRQQN